MWDLVQVCMSIRLHVFLALVIHWVGAVCSRIPMAHDATTCAVVWACPLRSHQLTNSVPRCGVWHIAAKNTEWGHSVQSSMHMNSSHPMKTESSHGRENYRVPAGQGKLEREGSRNLIGQACRESAKLSGMWGKSREMNTFPGLVQLLISNSKPISQFYCYTSNSMAIPYCCIFV